MNILFKNHVLNNEYKSILDRIIEIKKGSVGGVSLEIELRKADNEREYDSYIYKGYLNETDRDLDYETIINIISKPEVI